MKWECRCHYCVGDSREEIINKKYAEYDDWEEDFARLDRYGGGVDCKSTAHRAKGVRFPHRAQENKMEEELCKTCGEPYASVWKMSFRASLCSSSFHSCKDCIWDDGELIWMCEECDRYWKKEECGTDCGCK